MKGPFRTLLALAVVVALAGLVALALRKSTRQSSETARHSVTEAIRTFESAKYLEFDGTVRVAAGSATFNRILEYVRKAEGQEPAQSLKVPIGSSLRMWERIALVGTDGQRTEVDCEDWGQEGVKLTLKDPGRSVTVYIVDPRPYAKKGSDFKGALIDVNVRRVESTDRPDR